MSSGLHLRHCTCHSSCNPHSQPLSRLAGQPAARRKPGLHGKHPLPGAASLCTVLSHGSSWWSQQRGRAAVAVRSGIQFNEQFLSLYNTAVERQSSQAAQQIGIPDLQLTQEFAADGHTGHVIWSAGIKLASHLNQHMATDLPGKRVLELGCGTGVVGLTAAALGAHVTMTDLPQALDQPAANVARNECIIAAADGHATVAACDWHAPDSALIRGKSWDIVIGADLVYQHHVVKPLAALLAALQHSSPGVLMLLAHHHRCQELDAAMLAALEANGFGLEMLQDDCSGGTGLSPAQAVGGHDSAREGGEEALALYKIKSL